MIKNLIKTLGLALLLAPAVGNSQAIFNDSFDASKLKAIDFTDDALPATNVKNPQFNAVTGLLTVTRDTGTNPTQPPVDNCLTALPHSYIKSVSSWSNAFGAAYPGTQGALSPTGSWTLRASAPASQRGPSMAGRYLTIPFVPNANENVSIRMYAAQAIREVGYNPARIANPVNLSVSPCPGDLRMPIPFNPPTPDYNKCRVSIKEGRFSWSTVKPAPLSGCSLDAGKQYYLNIWFIDTTNGYPTGVTTCTKPEYNNRCEVNVGS